MNERHWITQSGDWYVHRNWSASAGGPGGATIPYVGDRAVFGTSAVVNAVLDDPFHWPEIVLLENWLCVTFHVRTYGFRQFRESLSYVSRRFVLGDDCILRFIVNGRDRLECYGKKGTVYAGLWGRKRQFRGEVTLDLSGTRANHLVVDWGDRPGRAMLIPWNAGSETIYQHRYKPGRYDLWVEACGTGRGNDVQALCFPVRVLPDDVFEPNRVTNHNVGMFS